MSKLCAALALLALTDSAPAQIPFDIPISGLQVDPLVPNRVYAGTTAGLLRSQDGGETWLQVPLTPLGTLQPPVYRLRFGGAASIVYLATSQAAGYFWRSLDGGQSWEQKNAGLPAGAGGTPADLEVSAADPSVIYLQVAAGGSQDIDLYKSTDRGDSWQKLASLPSPATVHRANPRIMYRSSGMEVFRSDDEGATWRTVGVVRNTPPNDLNGALVAVSPVNPNLLVASSTGPSVSLNGIFVSTDGGANWTRRVQGNFIGVEFNVYRPSEVFVGPPGGPIDSVWRSLDNGQTWGEILGFGPAGFTVRGQIGFHPSDGAIFYLPTSRGVYRTFNGGTTLLQTGTYRPTLVSVPDHIEASVLAWGRSAIGETLNLRYLETSAIVPEVTLEHVTADWLTARSVTTGAGRLLAVDITPGRLVAGSHEAKIVVRSSSNPVNPTLEIPVRLDVEDVSQSPLVLHTVARASNRFLVRDAVYDHRGNLYFVSGNRVFRLNGDGSTTVVAGQVQSGYAGDGGQAIEARLYLPAGIAIDRDGNIFISDRFNRVIRRVDASGIITTVAGTPTGGETIRGGVAATSVNLGLPAGIAIDSGNNPVFIAQERVIQLRPDGTLRVLAGGGTGFHLNVPATSTSLPNPERLAVDAEGNIYVSIQHRIVRIDRDGILRPAAGVGVAGFSGDGGPAIQAAIDSPSYLAPLPGGALAFYDRGNNRVRRILPGGAIETVAGNGLRGSPSNCTAATLVALDSIGALAVWDGKLRIISESGEVVRGIAELAPGPGSRPDVPAGGVGNAATFLPPLSPGSLFTVSGGTLAANRTVSTTPVWTAELGGAVVCINDEVAPLYFSSRTQINGQVPFQTTTSAAKLRVYNGNGSSAAMEVPIEPTAPGIFQYGADRAVAINPDGAVNSQFSPAPQRSIIVVYLTGQGELNPAIPTGHPAPFQPLSQPRAQVSASIGGQPAIVHFLGMTPGFVGLAQANIELPALPPGDHDLIIRIGANQSPPLKVSVAP